MIEKLPPNPFMQRRPKANDDAESSTTTRNSTASSAACYSVEKFGRGKFLAALLSTQINNQFFLKWTKNFGDTLAYIVSLSKHLNAKYSVRSFAAFSVGLSLIMHCLRQGTSRSCRTTWPTSISPMACCKAHPILRSVRGRLILQRVKGDHHHCRCWLLPSTIVAMTIFQSCTRKPCS